MTTPKSEEPITYMRGLHADIRCDGDDCDYEDRDPDNAIKNAEAHHRETGHELGGEHGFEVWVGSVGRQYLNPHPPFRVAATTTDTFSVLGELGYPIFIGVRGLGVSQVAEQVAQ